MPTPLSSSTHAEKIAFIGGGNMAMAIIGGLLKRGMAPGQFEVVEPFDAQRAKLMDLLGVKAQAQAGPGLATASLVVWAVKPQTFREAASQAADHIRQALHLSVAAGVRSSSITDWLGTGRVVRAMPNTPALIGKGMTGLFARDAVTAADRQTVEQVAHTMGSSLWLEDEAQLDAVTALSGSGPAYVFYFMEAMIEAGMQMGLSRDQAHRLSVATFTGSSELAAASTDAPETLRAQVTSKGGTTFAALMSMEQSDVKPRFIEAMRAAQNRAREMGDEFGAA
ncbi:MAG: pyrroline-5-carboxylate reductase [Polaromonas sp.]|jgi:pyrroline-5-carboxylate reductase|nr:pyrroline-5-carboxylate reductase [Polaromonas sp.]